MTRPVTPQATLINRKLAHLAGAGTLPIGNQPGQVGIGTAIWAEQCGFARRSPALDRVTITQAGRNHLWQEQAA